MTSAAEEYGDTEAHNDPQTNDVEDAELSATAAEDADAEPDEADTLPSAAQSSTTSESGNGNGHIDVAVGLRVPKTRRPQPLTPPLQEGEEPLTLAQELATHGSASLASSDSIPDDVPSEHASDHNYPRSITPLSRSSPASPGSVSSPSSQPFERRFKAQRTASGISVSRVGSPGFLTAHSRQSSLSSQIPQQSLQSDTIDGKDESPWEVVRWTKLKKISSQAFSESGRRAFGRPSYLAVAAFIAVGTSRGLVLLFDYQQTLKCIIGQGTAATEAGRVTSVAISADHSTVASGHGDGSIFTWEIARPARPFLHIPPIDKTVLDQRSSDGHVAGSAVLHVGFLGIRHTALVSADDSGMAFSHLASRGLGPLTRNVKTTRILGRYPQGPPAPEAPRKPSSVLSFSPLPLGNVEAATDSLGLTALLTPYLLVIVSTTPIAQTQFKMPRSKDVAAHSAMTGCLAWFPSVRLKGSDQDSVPKNSTTKLVFCWSNVLNILEVTEAPRNDPADADELPSLNFSQRGQWKCEESIVAVQWLSRSILVVLTLTQQLLILQDTTLTMTDSSDLNAKRIFNLDLFSRQLQPLVERLEANEPSMHGVVPHAYYMSFKTYKSRLFVLGANDVSMGSMSNWADRIVAYMEDDNYLGAIQLATAYYQGGSDIVTVGLPENDDKRHDMVGARLLEIMSSSLQYVFNDEEQAKLDKDIRTSLSELVAPVFNACLVMNNIDYLFDDVYEYYSDASCQDIFLYELEPIILDGRLQSVSPNILKDMTNLFSAMGHSTRLEDLICALDTASLDVDQVTLLCKDHGLFNAYIHVYNRALHDYVTPLAQLMRLLTSDSAAFGGDEDDVSSHVFSYMAYILTGRNYPQGDDLPEPLGSQAKDSIYNFLFSWQTMGSPARVGNTQTYPNLLMLLELDAGSMMSMLNEAFEDGYLNDNEDQRNFSRQKIINALNEVKVMDSLQPVARSYVSIFIARNVARFPTFVLLSGTGMRKLLVDLCHYPDDTMADECQLSAEYLLTVYHPTEVQTLIPILEEAGFYKILKSIYRANRQFVRWFETHFLSYDTTDEVFECLRICLMPETGLSKGQVSELRASILEHAHALATMNGKAFAIHLNNLASDILEDAYQRLQDDSLMQYTFLQSLFESHRWTLPSFKAINVSQTFLDEHAEEYITLMCEIEPQRVADYVLVLQSGDLQLRDLVPIMEMHGVVDAAVLVMARNGLTKDAMLRLKKHLRSLQTALVGLVSESSESDDDAIIHEPQSPATAILDDIRKYVDLGIWLCHGEDSKQSTEAKPQIARRRSRMQEIHIVESDLSSAEYMWLELLDSVVDLSRALNAVQPVDGSAEYLDHSTSSSHTIRDVVRQIVQNLFTALLASTTGETSAHQNRSSNADLPGGRSITIDVSRAGAWPSFLPILAALLHRFAVSLPTLADLRSTLLDIFSAYAFEESLLSLASSFIEKDVFAHVKTAERRRARGWRPARPVCEGCRRRCWGAGLGNGVWEAWRERSVVRAAEKRTHLGLEIGGTLAGSEPRSATSNGKGKGRAAPQAPSPPPPETAEDGEVEQRVDAIISFECGHLWHRRCLERAMPSRQSQQGQEEQEARGTWQCGAAPAQKPRPDWAL